MQRWQPSPACEAEQNTGLRKLLERNDQVPNLRELWAFVNETSDLCDTLLGLLHPTSGSASVLGLDVVRDSVKIRRRVGYLPSGFAVYDYMTGREYLDHMRALSGRPSLLRHRVMEALELSDAILKRPVRDYSRGMRQKIGVVQALETDPELLILDEPSEGLDPLMQRSLQELLLERVAAGRTVFFSSHLISEVERICNRVAIVRGGRLV